jgi:hypothetical protein
MLFCDKNLRRSQFVLKHHFYRIWKFGLFPPGSKAEVSNKISRPNTIAPGPQLKRALEEKPVHCEACGSTKVFESLAALVNHLIDEHVHLSAKKCKICDKVVKSGVFRRHMKMLHVYDEKACGQ